MNLGERIKQHRKSSNMTQEQLADMINVSKNTIWNYENNKSKVDIETLIDIAKALGLTLDSLIGSTPSFVQRYVMYLTNYNDKTLEEIATDLCLSKSRLNEILNNPGQLTGAELKKMFINCNSTAEESLNKILDFITWEDIFQMVRDGYEEFLTDAEISDKEFWSDEEAKQIKDFKDFLLMKRTK